ncbi:GGDEF domain-containing protein [Pseudonocardia petroleophila]|uniref:GGDEF domain-containing protein n=1 Tax=Pseudonocardia petroleophila TaxID=37331 RepID=A0A7G7MR21_9PSEU|nr:diguanylate cyclase [Pseudonocardia petroleophila]QNG55232.1 GGDEF domain-containing protein [Pseudonocardia petroleophila]
MTSPGVRPQPVPGSGRADFPGCSLIAGAPECDCPAVAHLLDDQALEARARGMFVWQQKAPPAGRAAARRGIDGLLAHARGRGPSALVAELLRMAVLVRVMDEDAANLVEIDGLLNAYGELAELSGDACWLAEVAVLRAHRAVIFDHGDAALPDTAAALAILADVAPPGPGEQGVVRSARMSRTLNGLLLVLLKLGAHELADEVSQRAVTVAESGSGPIDRLIHQLNRVRLQLSWALRLERGGRDAAAATRFVAAAQIAHIAERLWTDARDRHVGAGLPPVDECIVVGTAYAMHHPGPQHLSRLAHLGRAAFLLDDRILLAIAASRCHMTAGRPHDAVRALEPLRAELADRDGPEPLLALALHREFAKVEGAARGGVPRSPGLEHYAAALEDELWALREARLVALRSHSEHHRLTREHGAVAAQALQDPLTGLPNRRALDLRLAEEIAAPTSQPCIVALIDLDRFKDVNDARSHAAGDRVLRAVASCLRTALRAPDMVARYGGDEFVVVMPATPLPVARAALVRAAESVAALPEDVAAGVTMSVGVVRAPLDADPSAALAGADAAMYRAKHQGGNSVVIGAVPTGDMPAGPVERTGRLRKVASL